MIVVTGTIVLDQAKAGAARDALLTMMEASNAEDGCRSYRFMADLTDPGTFHVVEQWESDAAIDAHFASPHMADLLAKTADMGVTSTEIWRHDVSASSRLM